MQLGHLYGQLLRSAITMPPLQVVISLTNDVSAMFTSFDKVRKLTICTTACMLTAYLELNLMQRKWPCRQCCSSAVHAVLCASLRCFNC